MSRVHTMFALVVVLCQSAVTLAAGPAEPTGCKPLYGISYDPFSTSGTDICLSKEQVAIDVEIMATIAASIRIYSIALCPDATLTLLEEAKKHNVTVLLGILINSSAKDIEAELALLPIIMKRFSDVIQAIIVGNQALAGAKIGSKSRFADEMSNIELLSSYIIRVKAILRRRGYKHKVSTADSWVVWESENGYPISDVVDFLCLNLAPYYEGFEVECLLSLKGKCTTASNYVLKKASGLEEYYGMDVWVCETSWPTDGNSCCSGLYNYQQDGNKAKAANSVATKYLNKFVSGVKDRPYFISTAFDKDWRRVWSPCGACAEKNLALSSFKNGVCDLCEEEYKLGFFNQFRERNEAYELPSVKCKLPKLPKVRLAAEKKVEEEEEEEEEKEEKEEKKHTKEKASRKESKVETSVEKKATTKKTSSSVKTKEPASKNDEIKIVKEVKTTSPKTAPAKTPSKKETPSTKTAPAKTPSKKETTSTKTTSAETPSKKETTPTKTAPAETPSKKETTSSKTSATNASKTDVEISKSKSTSKTETKTDKED